jgi:hypothetical protein
MRTISTSYFVGAFFTFCFFIWNVNSNGPYDDVYSFFDGMLFTCGIALGILSRIDGK